MPRASLSAPKIREELAWVAQGTGPESVWLPRYAMRTRPRAFRARKSSGRSAGSISVPECRKYKWNGSRVAGSMTLK